MNTHGWVFLFCLISSLVWGVPQIQVRIGKDLDRIFISAMDLQSEFFFSGKTDQYEGRKGIHFYCRRKGRRGSFQPALLASLQSPTGLISWGEQRYRGVFNVTTSKDLNSCDLIHKTSIENYLSSLLAKEMSPHWPLEALKAQAVAARTYALVQSERNESHFFDLENSEKHQVSGSFFDQSSSTRRAAEETRGVVLVSQNQRIIPAFFHSQCGGRTYLPQKVWLTSVPGYRQVKCSYCHGLGMDKWHRSLPRKRLHKILMERKSGLRNVYLRKRLGRKFLPSHNFSVYSGADRDHVMIRGRGLGHGVGMCQYGAFEMARRGKSYREILAHYYPGLKLKKLY